MSNILIISAVFSPEPVVSAKLSEDIASELALAHKVTVIAPKPTRPFGFKLQIDKNKKTSYNLVNLESYTCPRSNTLGRLRESYSFGIVCKKYILENHNSIDIIYMNSWPIFSQYFIIKIAEKYNIKVVTHVQDVYPESLANKIPMASAVLNFVFLPIDKFVLKNSDRIIAISDNMKKYLAKTRNLIESKIEVVQNWQNETPFIEYNKTKKNLRNNDRLFTFMYMGNIGPVAGVDLLIESFYKSNLKKCKLIIAGSGSKKEELENMVSLRNIERVEFVVVADGKVPDIQGAADVMLLPIKKGAAASSIPSKLPAYMFSEKPIIGSLDLDSDTARVLLESDCGWVVTPENTKELQQKMIEVSNLENKKLEVKGMKGFQYAMEYLSKKNNLLKVVGIINKSLLKP